MSNKLMTYMINPTNPFYLRVEIQPKQIYWLHSRLEFINSTNHVTSHDLITLTVRLQLRQVRSTLDSRYILSVAPRTTLIPHFYRQPLWCKISVLCGDDMCRITIHAMVIPTNNAKIYKKLILVLESCTNIITDKCYAISYRHTNGHNPLLYTITYKVQQ